MPAIGDQVASLEHDHAEALAKIDSLTATNAALTSANTALTSENAALNKYADEIKAMVESVASGALKMLQAARAPIVPVVTNHVCINAGLTSEELNAGNANALASNSCEQPTPKPPVLRANDLTDEQLNDHVTDVVIRAGIILTPDEKRETIAIVRQANAVLPIQKIVQKLETEIADIPDAVERMLHHSSASSAPPVTALRMPVDMTCIVEHDAGGLPMFLRRGTTFDALARARFET